jgi:hypothetical protein
VGSAKSDHDPVKVLTGILGELPDSSVEDQEVQKNTSEVEKRKIDVRGKTLESWLEELEKGKLSKLSRDIERRIFITNDKANARNHGPKSVSGTPIVYCGTLL